MSIFSVFKSACSAFFIEHCCRKVQADFFCWKVTAFFSGDFPESFKLTALLLAVVLLGYEQCNVRVFRASSSKCEGSDQHSARDTPAICRLQKI